MASDDLPVPIRGLYMDDFKRRIDFVLAYKLPPPELDPMRSSSKLGTPTRHADPPAPSSGSADGGKADAQAIELTPLNAGAEPEASNAEARKHKEHIDRRRFFEENLRRTGIQLEYSDSQVRILIRSFSYNTRTATRTHLEHTVYIEFPFYQND